MPLPRWLSRINKRLLNPREIERGERPVLSHVGRTSGRVHRTPLQARAVDGGYLFNLLYGPESDWVKNVLAAGGAELAVDGEVVKLRNPRVVDSATAARALGEPTRRGRSSRQQLLMESVEVRDEVTP